MPHQLHHRDSTSYGPTRMSFNPERLVCYGCGRVGYIQRTCPKCTSECRYCKEKGHLITTCPKLEPCHLCLRKGHKPEHCRRTLRPTIQSSRPSRASNFPPALRTTTVWSSMNDTRRNGSPPPSQHTQLPSHTAPAQQTVNISITPPCHDDDVWRALDPEIRKV